MKVTPFVSICTIASTTYNQRNDATDAFEKSNESNALRVMYRDENTILKNEILHSVVAKAQPVADLSRDDKNLNNWYSNSNNEVIIVWN